MFNAVHMKYIAFVTRPLSLSGNVLDLFNPHFLNGRTSSFVAKVTSSISFLGPWTFPQADLPFTPQPPPPPLQLFPSGRHFQCHLDLNVAFGWDLNVGDLNVVAPLHVKELTWSKSRQNNLDFIRMLHTVLPKTSVYNQYMY